MNVSVFAFNIPQQCTFKTGKQTSEISQPLLLVIKQNCLHNIKKQKALQIIIKKFVFCFTFLSNLSALPV